MHLPKENKEGKVITLKKGEGVWWLNWWQVARGAVYGGERERKRER